jgi:hypothetical protein
MSLPLMLLAAILIALAGTSAYVVWQNYRTSAEAAAASSRQVFDILHDGAVLQENALTAPVRMAITALSQVPLVGRIDAGSVSRSFRPVLDAYPHVTALRIGFADGTVTDVSREAMPTMSGDPRPTPWYMAANATPGTTIETKPYRLSNGQPGISIARTINGAEGAMVADIELKQFALPLEKFSANADAQMFVFTADGTLVAHPDFTKVAAADAATSAELSLNAVDTLSDPAATAIVAAFRAGGPFTTRRIVAADRAYIAAVTKLEAADGDPPDSARFLAMALPERKFGGNFMADASDEVVVALVILLLSALAFVIVRAFRP